MTIDEKPRCRVCNSLALEKNYLFYCQSKTCDAVYWKINKTLKKDLKDDKIKKLIFLIESGVPINQKKGHYVYKLRLKGEVNSIYVGMTGLHPHERYLNHIIGYKASFRAKKFATALISFIKFLFLGLSIPKTTTLPRDSSWPERTAALSIIRT